MSESFTQKRVEISSLDKFPVMKNCAYAESHALKFATLVIWKNYTSFQACKIADVHISEITIFNVLELDEFDISTA